MAKETHVAQATNFRGIVLLKRHLSFTNTIEGFEKLQRWIEGLQQKHRLKNSSLAWSRQDITGLTWLIGLQTKA